MASIPDREYNQMVAQLHHQQRYIAALEADNRDLRRQLSELRRGVGITVAIHGQVMSLTAPVATVVNQSSEPADPNITGIFPSMQASSQPTYAAQQPMSASPIAPIAPMYPEHSLPQQGQAGQKEHPGSAANVQSRGDWGASPPASYSSHGQMPGHAPAANDYTENGWLTGPTPVVRPTTTPPMAAHHQLRPSQQMTPTWLREEPTEWPDLSTPATPPPHLTPDARPGSPRMQPMQPMQPMQQPVQPLQSSAADQFSTLARLTGQHPILYRSGQSGQSGQSRDQQPQRNPYTDSHVLSE